MSMLTSNYSTHQPKAIEENIELLKSKHIKRKNSTRQLPNQTQQPTSPEITASSDLRDCIGWKTIPTLTSDHLFLLATLSIHHNTKETPSHFTETITNYQKFNWALFKHYVEDLIFHRPHSTNVYKAFIRQAKILLRQYWMPTDSSSLKKNQNIINPTRLPSISANSFNNIITLENGTDHPKSLL